MTNLDTAWSHKLLSIACDQPAHIFAVDCFSPKNKAPKAIYSFAPSPKRETPENSRQKCSKMEK